MPGKVHWSTYWAVTLGSRTAWNREAWMQLVLNCSWSRNVSCMWKEQVGGKSRLLSEHSSHTSSATAPCFLKSHPGRPFLTKACLHIFILHVNLWIPKGCLEVCTVHTHLRFTTSGKCLLGLISFSCQVQLVHVGMGTTIAQSVLVQ